MKKLFIVVCVLILGIVIAVLPLELWPHISGRVLLSGDVVLVDGTPPNIFSRALGRLIVVFSAATFLITLITAYLAGRPTNSKQEK